MINDRPRYMNAFTVAVLKYRQIKLVSDHA